MNGKELEGGKDSRGRCRAGVEGKASWWKKTGGKAEHEKNGKRRRKTRKQIYKKDTYERKMTGP